MQLVWVGQGGKWKDGCVRPSSSISKALPKRFSCRRPLKACEIRRWDPKEHASFENSQRPPSHPEIFSQVSRRERVQAGEQLDQVTVGSRYLVTPFVWIVRSPFTVSPNKQEVKSVISIPVSALLEPDCFATELKADGSPRVIHHFRCEALDIWGATSRILKQLLEVAYGFRANGKLI
jgi:hypothetical protein